MGPREPALKVSVVLAARNEEAVLARCLDSLVAQTHPEREILVVDDGSEDRTGDIAQSYAERHPEVRWVRIPHEGQGCVRPRMEGIARTDGPVVAVVEADAVYDPQFLSRCADHFRNPRVGAVVARLEVYEPRTWIGRCRDLQFRARFLDPENVRQEIRVGRIGVHVFSRAAYRDVGGYDPGNPYGDDTVLARRLRDRGYAIVYEPEARWFHEWADRPGDLVRFGFRVGREIARNRARQPRETLRALFFASVAAPVLSPWVPHLLYWPGVHLAVLYARAARFLRSDRNRRYFFLFPFFLYLHDLPKAAGFLWQLLLRRPLRSTGNTAGDRASRPAPGGKSGRELGGRL